jgi:glycosyltransferase involved in cell wall biosynthesis
MNITACIITNNDPKVLNAIKSVYDSVSEVILVNTSDRFELDIKGLDKVKLHWFKWCDDFGKARNYSISKATGDYILTIDSDETLETDISKLTDEFDFYFAEINNNGKLYKNIRIFRNHIGIKYDNMIHESVENSCQNLKGAKTNIIFGHSGYELSSYELKKKAERNYRILLKDKKNIGRNIHFAKHYHALGDYKSAIFYAEKALKQNNINEDNKAILCILIFDCYNMMNMPYAGIDYLRLSIEMLPMQIHSRYLLVNYLYSLSDRFKHKELILKQLIAIGSLITFRNSEMSNDIYCDINFVNKTRKEIEKWQ